MPNATHLEQDGLPGRESSEASHFMGEVLLIGQTGVDVLLLFLLADAAQPLHD